MKPYLGIVSLVLVLMAASSLVSMVSMLKIDSIVHGDLYSYGLRFNYHWAAPYWTMTIIVFGVGWFNILTSIAFQFYVLIYGKEKDAAKQEIQKEQWPTKSEVASVSEAITSETAEVADAPKEQIAASVPESAETHERELEEASTAVAEVPVEMSQQETSETEAVVEEQEPPESQLGEDQVPSETSDQETPPITGETEQQETAETIEETPEAQTATEMPEEQPSATDEDSQSQQQTDSN